MQSEFAGSQFYLKMYKVAGIFTRQVEYTYKK